MMMVAIDVVFWRKLKDFLLGDARLRARGLRIRQILQRLMAH